MTLNTCPFCHEPAVNQSLTSLNDLHEVRCDRCGHFEITDEGLEYARQATTAGVVYRFSWYVREATEHERVLRLDVEDLKDMLRRGVPSVSESFNRLLLYIGHRTKSISGQTLIKPNRDYPMARVSNAMDCFHLLKMLGEKRLIQLGTSLMNESTQVSVRPTLEGWGRIEELSRSVGTSDQVFVAMWFDDSVKPIFSEVFEPAASRAGFRALRVDGLEHNDKIDDLIVAEIQRSRFLIADITGHRTGVYWEAGYAMGLGIPVIWTCRRDDAGGTHFDIRQYNRIEWEPDKLGAFQERVYNRIRATIPASLRTGLHR